LSDIGFETALDRGVLTVRLARPDKMNALRVQDITALKVTFDEADGNDEVRSILLTGAGRAFCAGRDISDAKPSEDGEALLRDHINPMVFSLYNCRKPTVAAVNGASMGIGLGLALACDVVFAGESAVFSSPFAKQRAALDTGGHFFLPLRIPIGRVFEMIYTASPVGGAEAVRLGLADRLAPDSVLVSSAASLAHQISEGPQMAFQGQKAILRKDTELLSNILAKEARLQGSLSNTPEYAEGLRAFREKRPPDFRTASKEA